MTDKKILEHIIMKPELHIKLNLKMNLFDRRIKVSKNIKIKNLSELVIKKLLIKLCTFDIIDSRISDSMFEKDGTETLETIWLVCTVAFENKKKIDL